MYVGQGRLTFFFFILFLSHKGPKVFMYVDDSERVKTLGNVHVVQIGPVYVLTYIGYKTHSQVMLSSTNHLGNNIVCC